MQSLYDAMHSAGCGGARELTADGKIHRFRIDGDKSPDAGWYVLHADGDFEAACFGSWKGGETHKWTNRNGSGLSKSDRETIARLTAERDAERQRQADAAAKKAQAIWEAAQPAPDDHPYLVRKNIQPHVARVDGEGRLVLPLRRGGALVSVQTIYPDGKKRFTTGSIKKGAFFGMGQDRETIAICEGFATAATVRQATGLSVVIAFDAGNLDPVCSALRSKFPQAKLVIFGDNDENGIGQSKARAAGEAHRCEVLLPSAHGDWNDFGEEAVREAWDAHSGSGVSSAVRGEPVSMVLAVRRALDERANQAKETERGEDAQAGETGPHSEIHDERYPRNNENDGKYGEGLGNYDLPELASPTDEHPRSPVPLGFVYDSVNATIKFAYFSSETGQPFYLTAPEHTPRNLQAMASETYYWQRSQFAGQKKVDYDSAAGWLMDACKERGMFDPNIIRGRGAWIERRNGKPTPIVHLGETLVIDGEHVSPGAFKSKFIYPRALPFIEEWQPPLSNAEANKITTICEGLRWHNPLHGKLLAGWIATAPICGCMDWRPSLWVSGMSGSGKGWALTNIVAPLLGKSVLWVKGSTTEAFMRQTLKQDARPVIFDEAEQEDQQAKTRMKAILDLVRQSSSEDGAVIGRGSAGGDGYGYRIRSMFLFSSINIAVEKQADETRITQVTFRNPVKKGTPEFEEDSERFKRLEALVAETITEDYATRLMARSVGLAAVIRENAKTFARVCAREWDPRIGEQLGALLAGAYSLTSTQVVSLEKAEEIIRKYNWRDSTAADAMSDHEDLLNAILHHQLKYEKSHGGTGERSIVELLEYASNHDREADLLLRRHGLRYQREGSNASATEKLTGGQEGFWVSTTHHGLKRILHATQWSSKWGKALERLPGAIYSGKENVRFHGNAVSRAVFVPMAMREVSDGAGEVAEDIPY